MKETECHVWVSVYWVTECQPYQANMYLFAVPLIRSYGV